MISFKCTINPFPLLCHNLQEKVAITIKTVDSLHDTILLFESVSYNAQLRKLPSQ